MSGEIWTGGCQCGHVRYEARTRPRDAAYCHCSMCRRLHAAPVAAYADVPVEDFAYVAGEPAVYASSAQAERRFCPRCGSQLEFRLRQNPQVVEIAISTLDRAAEIAPEYHIWSESRLPWFDTVDTLPRRRRETE